MKIYALVSSMDYRSGPLTSGIPRGDSGCSKQSGIPDCLIDSIDLKLDTKNNMLHSFKEIERLHWDYLDNYRDLNRRKYPTININDFAIRLFRVKGLTHRS